MWDVDTIYKVPRMLHEQGLDGLICDKLRLNTPPANLKRWGRAGVRVGTPDRAKSPSPWSASTST
jgi:CTP synthase (UTP-ammonia lyase)